MEKIRPGIWQIEKGRYRIRVSVKDRTRRTREVDRVVTAKNTKEAIAMREKLREKLRERSGPRMTLGTFANYWIVSSRKKVARSTARKIANHLDRLGWLSALIVDEITPMDVQRRVDELKGKPSTINGILQTWRSMLRDAVAWLRLDFDPVARVTGPAVEKKTDERDANRLTAPELRAVLEAAKAEPAWYPLWATLAWTGTRWGEATALRWEDIDFEKREATLRRAQYLGEIKDTKTGSVRTVALPTPLVDLLKAHRQQLLTEQDRVSSGLVLPNRDGGMFQNGSNAHMAWNRVLRAAGIQRRVTIHGLRRTYNNLLRQVSPEIVVRSLTGHVTGQMTEHYSHVEGAEKHAAVDGMLRLVEGE